MYTDGGYRLDRALAQQNPAAAELAIIDHGLPPDPAPHVQAALPHVDAALTVFDPINLATNFNKASRLRDHIQACLAADEGLGFAKNLEVLDIKR